MKLGRIGRSRQANNTLGKPSWSPRVFVFETVASIRSIRRYGFDRWWWEWWRSRREAVAEARARNLLAHLLSEEELRDVSASGYLDIPSPNFKGRAYRVPYAQGLVAVMESGGAVAHLCVRPRGQLPPADVLISHKLMIESNEEGYLREANRFEC